MSSILFSLRKLSDKIFGAGSTEPGMSVETAEAIKASILGIGSDQNPRPWSPMEKGAAERVHRTKNTAPDPLTKAENASCGADMSEGTPVPSDHTDQIPLDVLLIAREAEAIECMEDNPDYAAMVRAGECDDSSEVRTHARAILMDRVQHWATVVAETDVDLPPYPWWSRELPRCRCQMSLKSGSSSSKAAKDVSP